MASRPIVLGLARIAGLAFAQLPVASAAPLTALATPGTTESLDPSNGAGLWLYMGIAAALVLSGGAFAGLTIALMGQVCCCYGRGLLSWANANSVG